MMRSLCRVVVPVWGCLYSEVKCIMGNGHMVPPPVDRQTDTTKNITFPQPRWWAVRINYRNHNYRNCHNRYDQDSQQKVRFKLFSSRTSFQLEEEVLDTANLTVCHVQWVLFCKVPCTSLPGLISDKPSGKVGEVSYTSPANGKVPPKG